MKTLLGVLTFLITFSINCSSPTKPGCAVEFGELIVPENRKDPNSRLISISYARISSKQDTDRPPIIFLQGGPGGSSLSMQNFFSNNPLSTFHDIILFDARGTGQSDAFCRNAGNQFMEILKQDLTVKQEFEATLKICEKCKKELDAKKVDLAGYNSMENAADVEDLRNHLGIDKWILLGGSYGTKLGLTYMREYDAAEAAIFMGLFPLEINIYEEFVEGFKSSLDNLFEQCANDPDCNQKYPDLRSTFESGIQKLRAEPRTIVYQGEEFVVNAQDALLFLHQMLYSRQTIQRAPAFISALEKEEYGPLVQSIRTTATRLAFINVATYWSVQAFEEIPFNDKKGIQNDLASYPALQPGPAFFASDQAVLEQWHPFRADEIENEPVEVETPILLVNGHFDPITPMSNARRVMKYLPNATLVEFPYDGHTVFNSCFFDLVEEFVSGDYKGVDGSCALDGTLRWQ